MLQSIARCLHWSREMIPFSWFRRRSSNATAVVGSFTSHIGDVYDTPPVVLVVTSLAVLRTAARIVKLSIGNNTSDPLYTISLNGSTTRLHDSSKFLCHTSRGFSLLTMNMTRGFTSTRSSPFTGAAI